MTSLVKAIDKATAENGKKKMGSFVVFCNDSEKLEDELKELAKKEKLEKCVLTLVDSKSGPGGYELHKDADITVVLYSGRKTKAQFAYKKGEFKEKDVQEVVEALPKILTK
ncbi:MAG: hypothetical protein ACRC33_23525 [Gemmataceae bacterium]